MSNIIKNKIRLIENVNDLPDAVSSVITLEDGYTYFFTKDVNLLGARLDCNGIVCLFGTSPETCSISSTGLLGSTALITSEHSITIKGLAISHSTALDLDATLNADQAIDWAYVNFVNCETVGTIKAYNNTIFNTLGFLNSGDLTFDGSIGTIGFVDTLFENASGKTSVIIPSTATITRRFRIRYSAFVSLSGETALNVSKTATIPDEGYILQNCNFAGGGTYISGVQSTDNKARFNDNRGIDNSGNLAQYYWIGNATATTVSAINTFYKVSGTSTSGTYVEKFDVTTTNNRAEYTGALSGFYQVLVTASCSAGNNQVLEVAIGKNGTVANSSISEGTTSGSGKAENIKSHDIVFLENGDYIEVFVANETATTNITVEYLNVIVTRLN